MEENTTTSQPEEAEISLKEMFGRIRAFGAEIRRYWLTIGLIALPFVAWQGYVAFTTPVTFTTKLTFMVDDSNGGRIGLLNSLLGDIGLPSGQSNYEKILELAKSMRIMRQALLTKVTIDGKEDLLANHLIRIQNIHEEEWYKKPKDPNQPSLNNFYFTNDQFQQFQRVELAALKSLYGILLGDEEHTPLLSSKYNQDSGIMTLSAQTRSEALTIALLQSVFAHLSDFYITSSTEKEQITYDIIRGKADSLLRLLAGTESLAARFKDQNNALINSIDKLPTERFARNKSLYTLMYGESLKNLEIADFALKNRTPYVQPIDMPIPPLSGTGYGKKKALLLGLGLGLAFGILFVVIRKLVRDQLQEA
jgi:hypothetical protein